MASCDAGSSAGGTPRDGAATHALQCCMAITPLKVVIYLILWYMTAQNTPWAKAMSSTEWTQLEHVSAQLEDLHHRRLFAERHNNGQLARQIDEQISIAEARRKRLLDRIMILLAEKA